MQQDNNNSSKTSSRKVDKAALKEAIAARQKAIKSNQVIRKSETGV